MILVLKDLRSGYRKVSVIQGVNITIEKGEIVAVIGRNGMGKTTLIRTIIGLIKPSSGSIIFNGKDVTGMSAAERARYGMGYVPQGREVFPKLTVRENIRMGELVSSYNNGKEKSYDIVYETFPILKERGSQKAGTLSGGEQQMLALGRVLVGKPSLLLLDEPSEGIQPSIVKQIGASILKLNKELDLSIFLAEQNVNVIKTMADQCYVIDRGIINKNFQREEFANTSVLEQCLVI